MKTNCSSGMTYHQVDVCIAGLDRCSFFDHRDKLRVVEVGCTKCGITFSEELEAAKLKVTNGEMLVCIGCDENADRPAFRGITVQIGWE